MNASRLYLLLFSILLLAGAGGCSRQKEPFSVPEYAAQQLTELMPLIPGKYITYRLDSLVFTQLGTQSEIRRYRVKYLVDTVLTDNLGQKSFRVYRFLNDSAATGSWVSAGTGYITPMHNRIEVVEDNLRSVALMLPVREGFVWKGNQQLPDAPYNIPFADMPAWDFTYGPEAPAQIGGRQIEGVRMVYQADKKLNALYDRPIVDTTNGYNITATSGYAKNIGLVYRELTLWENQNMPTRIVDPVTKDTSYSYRPYRNGFGIRMWMVDHN